MWSIGCVRTGGEISLAERLSQSGASTYLPMGVKHVRRARKRCKATIPSPAFPGYLFLEDHTVTDRIYEEPGFYDFIRLEGQRYLLRDEAISDLRAMEDRSMFSDEKPGRPRFTIGEVLRVPEGIFGGMVGIVQHVAGSDVWLGGRDFSKPLRLNGLILLQSQVEYSV